MNRYSILTNRKRAVIALVHSVFFFFVALAGLFGPSAIPPLTMAMARQSHFAPALAITVVYLVVTGILVWLVRLSAALREKLYFAMLCDQCRNRSVARPVRRYLTACRSRHSGHHARLRDCDLHADLAFASSGNVAGSLAVSGSIISLVGVSTHSRKECHGDRSEAEDRGPRRGSARWGDCGATLCFRQQKHKVARLRSP